ncbi:MAG: efflux RND transporter periplasmic adaptor subunit [Salinivirgaceae bacterium]|nr:efflux RND transporter periplasmic adaptor subunit [Salinivirgaceae bacterium]MBO7593401.1 efflux RND transporter periplasmic adaptor subunit [Salinivirgaceae bacterium]
MKTKQLISIAIIAGVALCAAACKEDAKKEQKARIEKVKVQKLSKVQIDRVYEVSTTLQGYETMNIAPSLTGAIEHIYVEIGSKVNAGQDLVRMDQTQYKTAKLTYDNLTTEMQRMDALKESGNVSQQTYDQTKVAYDQAKQNLDFLRQNTYVKAKFAGSITAKNYEDGELYGGGPIMTLTQINVLKAYINIPESYFPHVKEGMTLALKSDIYPDKEFKATVEIVHPTIDAASHTFQAKIKIDNKANYLRPGMFVRTTMPISKQEVIIAPYQAVMKQIGSNDRYVFINDKGFAKRVAVKMGQRFDENVEIISDEITETDELIVVGQGHVNDGVQIDIVK